jgi:serine/threonine-protein kinase
MANDLERAVVPATAATVAAWVESLASTELATRCELVKAFEDTLVMAAPARPAPQRIPRAAWALVAALALVGAGLLAWRTSSAVPASAASPSASASQELQAEAPPTDDPSSPPLLAAPSTKPTHPKSRPPRAAPRVRQPDACDPPYVVDAAGHKIFKLACIK